MKIKIAVYLTALLVALLVAGCGDDKTTDSGGEETTTEQSSTEATGSTGEESSSGELPTVSGKLGEEPKLSIPEGGPPSELVIKDIEKGDGKKVASGDDLTMQYAGYNWSDGVMFDASWKSGNPFDFEIGAGQVIKGWDEGIVGMREGGRRLLVIPPDMGYGESGQPPTIPPNETLVFVVDLEKVK
ncbi:MAG: FKBP-type peptidyl-prolyl cis-trans isomerase [Actinobacteria bacterium]|nr:FKBP-type peptidyl-prolyl cis-trans isomerase [Actinomycetota bacterium]